MAFVMFLFAIGDGAYDAPLVGFSLQQEKVATLPSSYSFSSFFFLKRNSCFVFIHVDIFFSTLIYFFQF